MIEEIRYINKILRLRSQGYDVIENVEFEILEDNLELIDGNKN